MTTRPIALAAYGTLAPGEINHFVMDGVAGTWYRGTVRGHYWVWSDGPYVGLPAIRLDPAGPAVEVSVLVAPQLGRHLDRLDDFEGPGYRRVPTTVTYDHEVAAPPEAASAWIYEAIPGYAGDDGTGQPIAAD